MTLAKGCDIWLQQHKTAIKESTYQRYRTIIENHIKPDWENGSLATWIVPDSRNTVCFFEPGPVTGTVRNILSLFRMVLEDMSREGEATNTR